jgi:hypothetical protein
VSHHDRSRDFDVATILKSLDCPDADQQRVVGKLLKNATTISTYRGVTEERMTEILQVSVNLFTVDWVGERVRLAEYQAALPFLERMVSESGLEAEAGALMIARHDFSIRKTNGQAANDLARAIKHVVGASRVECTPPIGLEWATEVQFTREVDMKPNYALVVEILAAYYDEVGDTQWTLDRVTKL